MSYDEEEYARACRELEGDLQKGQFLATQLVNHLLTMGADCRTSDVIVRDVTYEVIVRRKEIKP